MARLFFYPEDEVDTFLRNDGSCIDNTTLYAIKWAMFVSQIDDTARDTKLVLPGIKFV
jgi:hypothetical protein